MVDPLVLAVLFFGGALLYASVGHAGASAYLAIMGLAGVAPDVARPTALALNIVVATFVTFRFWRGGHVSGRALLPFLLGSIPLAFLGGSLPVAPAPEGRQTRDLQPPPLHRAERIPDHC